MTATGPAEFAEPVEPGTPATGLSLTRVRPADVDPGTDRPAAARLAGGAGSSAVARLCALAGRLLRDSAAEGPIGIQVSLLADQQVIAGGSGLPAEAIGARSPVEDSLCTVTARAGKPVRIDDARRDTRVATLPPVTSGQVGSYLGVPLLAPGGTPVGALCAFTPAPRSWTERDTTVLTELADAVAAQLELQALSADFATSRARWDVAISAARIGTFDWNIVTGRLDWDDRMHELFGYRPGEFRPHIDVGFQRVHADDRPAVDAAIEQAVRTCGDYRAEFRVQLPDGTRRWLGARGRALPGPGGRAGRLVGTCYDITKIRTARDEAAHQLETMATGFIALDREWRVTYVNAEAERVVGMGRADLVGRVVWSAFPDLENMEFGRRYKHAMATGETVQLEAYYPHLASWFEVRAVPSAEGLALYFLDVTGRHTDRERAESANRRLELLAAVSTELADAGLEVERAVAGLARNVVPVLADWCIVSLVDGPLVRDVGHWHADAAQRDPVATYCRERLVGRTDLGAVQQARDTGRAVLIDHDVTNSVLPALGSVLAREALRTLAPESVAVVPMIARGHMTGLLTLLRDADRPPINADELTTATEVASRAALVLDNARLFAEQRGLAEALQRSLLTTPPQPDHCEIAVRYMPAAEVASVGGDWFDAFLQPDGATVVVIGDVMGHDTAAAAAMGQVRSLLRGIAWDTGATPARILKKLDAAMLGLRVGTTATSVVARLEQSQEQFDRQQTTLRWSNAGHLPPVLLLPDGSVTDLAGARPELLLGLDAGRERTDHAVVLPRGCTVLLYTDGLIERRDQDLEAGIALLHEQLAELAGEPLDTLCDELLRRLMPHDASDDVALIAIRLHPEV